MLMKKISKPATIMALAVALSARFNGTSTRTAR